MKEHWRAFDKKWFSKHQKTLLFLLNAPVLKYLTRYIFRIRKYDCPIDSNINRILKHEEEFYNNHKYTVAAGKEPTPWSVEVDPHTGKYTSVYADEVLSPTAKQEMKEFKNKLRAADRDRFLFENSMMNHSDDMSEIAREFDTYQKQHSTFDTQEINPIDFYHNMVGDDMPF